MHLIKLQTPSSQASGYRRRPAAQPSRLLVTLLALGAASWRGSYQVVDSVADFAAAAAGSGASTGHNSALVELAHRRTQENLTEQKCRPVLNFALPQVDQRIPRQRAASSVTSSNNNFNNIQHYSTTGQKLSQSIPDSFSFPIGDINLPLTPTAGGLGSNPGNSNVGAVQAAMKLLAAFDAQLYGGGSGEADGDDSSGDTNLMADEEQNVVRFKQNRLFISGLNFTMLNVHLYQDAEPRFAIGVNIANTTLAGQFQYDGYAPASLIGSDYAKLAGHYRMSIDNLLLTVASNLTKVFKSGDQISPVKYRYQLASNDLRMNISNLGYISIEILDAQDASKPTSNYVLKMLERVLQKTIKRTYNKFEDYIRSTLELEGRKFLDCELTRFAPLLTENLRDESRNRLPKVSPQAPIISTINDNNATQAAEATLVVLESITTTVFEKFPNNSYYLDDLAKIISTEIANSRLDKISLPDFDYQRSVFGSSADISFQNGSLSGLDNIRLTGETRVKLLEEHLIVNASVGWTDLRPQYNWTLYFGGGGGGSPSQHQESVTLVADNSDRRASMSAQINTTVTDITTSSSLSSKNQQAAQVKPSQQPQPTAKPMAKGFVSFSIKAIEFDAVISKSVRSQSRMVVDELIIRRLDNPKMDIGGLPGLNRLTRGAVNFFMGRLKQRLVSSIQPALKQELERALNRLALFN